MISVFGPRESLIRLYLDIDRRNVNYISIEFDVFAECVTNELLDEVGVAVDIKVIDTFVSFDKVHSIAHRVEVHLG